MDAFCSKFLILLTSFGLFAQGSGKTTDVAGLELEFWSCRGGGVSECEQKRWPLRVGVANEVLALNNSSEQPIIIFTHGVLENVHDDAANGKNSTWKYIQKAYGDEGFEHFVFIKWEAIHIQPRRRKILQSRSISSLAPIIRDKILDFVADLVLEGVSPFRVHLIGQNVGAHIMGAVGHSFQARTYSRIGRITGLDPSSPLFLSILGNGKTSDPAMVLDPSDAEFVDVVHTDSNGLGSLTSFGHVDWYVNGGPGSMQNGCTLPLDQIPFLSELLTIGCAHTRASSLWAYAIGRNVQLRGCPCKKVTTRISGKSFCKSIGVEPCGASPRVLRFGQYTPRNARGDYYLHISDTVFEQLPPVWYQSQMADQAGTLVV